MATAITEGKLFAYPNGPYPVLTLHADEAALYDRQIRLWGLEAQQRSAQLSARLRAISDNVFLS
jgi:hypothetical protein